jgi:hypothetical protein
VTERALHRVLHAKEGSPRRVNDHRLATSIAEVHSSCR